MLVDEKFIISISQWMLGFSLLMQTIEYLYLRKVFSLEGIWRPRFFNNNFFIMILVLRLFFSFLLFFKLSFLMILIALVFLILSTFLIAFRCGAAFNGGSDSMTLMLLIGLLLTYTVSEKFGLYFIAVQSVLSYSISGWVKIKTRNWRSGQALKSYLNLSPYKTLPNFLCNSNYKISSWLVMLFDLSFPLVLFPFLLPFYLLSGFVFHLLNVRFFGINRFFHIWLATYPSILYLSLSVF